jgi:hypothetical protein
MALFSECTDSCAQKLLDTADIVREAIFRQLSDLMFTIEQSSCCGLLHHLQPMVLHTLRSRTIRRDYPFWKNVGAEYG